MLAARLLRVTLAALSATLLATVAGAQTFGPDFAGTYSFTDLGGPPGIPTPLGGITFKAGDNDTLLIGGAANTGAGAIYEIPVTRNAQGEITGFAGSATLFATAPNIDGGLTYGPGGVLFFVGYTSNTMGQIKPGSTAPDKTIDLTALGVCSSTGALTFVPAGFGGAGRLKIVSYNCASWYDADVTPDGTGTYDLVNVTQTATLVSSPDPEGMVYIDSVNPGFSVDSVLVSEWASGRVGAYEIDANGDPVTSKRRDFLTGLTGAEGAVIDPLTGDFLFSTFGGGDRVLVVGGFTTPTKYCDGKVNSQGCRPTIYFAGSPTLSGPDDFVVASDQSANRCMGTLLWGLAPASTPFGGGTLCIALALGGFGGTSSGGNPGGPSDCSGTFSFPVTQAFFTNYGITAGTQVYMQVVSRDPGFVPPDAVGLSDALTFQVLP